MRRGGAEKAASVLRDRLTEDVMRDLKADWRKWTSAERSIAKCFLLAMSCTISALYFLGLG
jgi:hypothetical protein